MSTTKKVGGWLQGKTVRKTANVSASRSNALHAQSGVSTSFGGGVKDPSGRTTEFFSKDDQCPVCKSDRYLNPQLRLLVSSCYHKMCESCIDRLFTLGPAPCPICNKVLRKLTFVPQTFEDLGVEKEVAIRRRLAKEFNKTRDDFDNLREYNDYLEEVENIAFNLINNIDLPETEAKIAAYRAANATVIATNAQREEAYAQALREQEEQDRKERQLRAQELRQEEELERQDKQRIQQELIDKLETSNKDAKTLVAKAKASAAKKAASKVAAANSAASYARLLKTRTATQAAVPDVPHVPLQDDWYAYDDLYTLREGGYDDPFSEAVRKDREGIMRAGGYRVEEAWDRALRFAVAGLEISPLVGLNHEQEVEITSEFGKSDGGGDVIMAQG